MSRNRRQGVAISREDRDKVVKLLQYGVEPEFIEERLGLCWATIRNIAKQAGVDTDVGDHMPRTFSERKAVNRRGN
jgi:hypothetical protein